MPLNRALVGRTWTQRGAVRVDPERARAFAEAVGREDPGIPPMLACTLGFGAWTAPFFDPELAVEMMRLALESHALELLAPLTAGVETSSVSELIAIEDTDWGERLRLRLTTIADGAVVARAESAFRLRKTPKGVRTSRLLEAERAAIQEGLRAFEGEPEVARADIEIDTNLGARFAEATSDPNPIRFDPEAARQAGLPTPVLHELCTLTVVHDAAERALGPIRRVSAAFSSPVLPGDSLVLEARGDAARPAVWVRNQRGEVVVSHGEVEVSP
jgi:acyl dehydratase